LNSSLNHVPPKGDVRMATRKVAPKVRRGRNRPGKSKGGDTASKSRRGRSGRRGSTVQPMSAAYGVPVPEVLHEAIESERDNLSKAESVLGCLMISMEYEADPDDGPYYPDVAQLARDLVKQSIDQLDSLVLQKRLLGNKVREGTGLAWVEGAYLVPGVLANAA
ncbi:MAG: hypothetical protein ACRETL_05315, partial [Gammaproteobacteria bacterium]